MKKEQDITPKDNIERFLEIMLSLVEALGVDQEEDVHHYVILLQRAIERYVFNKSRGIVKEGPKKKIHQFVAIFKQRFLQLVDCEYTDRPSPIEGRLIKSVIEKVEEAGLTAEGYIQWMFEEFLPENVKFIPPNIKMICASHFVVSYIYAKRDEVKNRKEERIWEKDVTDLANRARVIIKSPKIPDDSKDYLRNSLKKASQRDITLEGLRVEVERLEEKLR